MKAAGDDGLEQAGAFEVRGDDLRDFLADAWAGEFGDGDGDGAHLPAPDFNLDLRPCGVRREQCESDQRQCQLRGKR